MGMDEELKEAFINEYKENRFVYELILQRNKAGKEAGYTFRCIDALSEWTMWKGKGESAEEAMKAAWSAAIQVAEEEEKIDE
jgi:dsRNA-specific ribonuclease